MCGFQADDFDLILNSAHFIIYGKRTLHFDFDEVASPSWVPNEVIASMKWCESGYFKNFTFEQMQEKVALSRLSCDNGIVSVWVPIS